MTGVEHVSARAPSAAIRSGVSFLLLILFEGETMIGMYAKAHNEGLFAGRDVGNASKTPAWMPTTIKYCSNRVVTIAALGVLVGGCERTSQTALPGAGRATPPPEEAEIRQATEPSSITTSPPTVVPQNREAEPKPGPADLAREFRASTEPDRRGELAGDLCEIGTPEAL